MEEYILFVGTALPGAYCQINIPIKTQPTNQRGRIAQGRAESLGEIFARMKTWTPSQEDLQKCGPEGPMTIRNTYQGKSPTTGHAIGPNCRRVGLGRQGGKPGQQGSSIILTADKERTEIGNYQNGT